MRVLSIHAGSDTGGTGWNLTGAFATHAPEIEFRSCVKKTNYLEYPHDADWTEARELWRRTDVAHTHNTLRTMSQMVGAKPFLLHHHGTYYRENHERLNAQVARNGGKSVVSTLDLLRFGDNLTWIPQAHRIAATKNTPPMKGRKLRVAHAPTNRAIKDTEAFLAACDKAGVEPVLIEGKSWAECVQIKSTCDVLYDQVGLGYGNNAIEAWAMGIPVIAGATQDILDIMGATFDKIPFLEATPETITDALIAMKSTTTRNQWARTGKAHVERWHDGRESVARLTTIYRELAA